MNLLLGFCLLTVAVCKISALECYNCIGCDDEFNSNGISKVACSGSCSKSKAEGRVVRNCLPLLKMDECKEKDGAEVCLCTSDLCNGATQKYVSIFSLIMTVACIILNILKSIL